MRAGVAAGGGAAQNPPVAAVCGCIHTEEDPMTRPIRGCCAAAVLLATAAAAHGADFNALKLLNQAEFRAFSEDVGAAVSYKGMVPAESLGIIGFDMGLSAGVTEVAHREVLSKAAGGASVPKAVPLAGVHVLKGVSFDVDLGITYLTLPGTNVRATGGEVRWAFIAGSALVPAVAVRLSTMKLSGVDELQMRAHGADISVSKGFLFGTPYAGIGRVKVISKAPGTALANESFNQNKVFAGVNIALVPLALVLEVDKTGGATTFGAKIAIRW
jgi:hypothetical protein